MAELLLFFLCSYGLAFFVQNKLWRPKKLPWLLQTLFSCIYCLGFWSGVFLRIAQILVRGMEGTSQELLLDILTFGFASSAFSYALDQAVRYFENRAG